MIYCAYLSPLPSIQKVSVEYWTWVNNGETKIKIFFVYPSSLKRNRIVFGPSVKPYRQQNLKMLSPWLWTMDGWKTLGYFLFLLTVFNTNTRTMDTCAAEQYCQKFHQNKYLYNESTNFAVECDNCNQWFHCDCLSFTPREFEESERVFCDCHLSDLWGTTLWVLCGKLFSVIVTL